jgi:flagellar protein FliO/FliZ
MAQRLEAALRRPAGEPAAPDRAPPVAPESPGRPVPPRAASEVSVRPPSQAEAAAAPGPKISLDNLEDEMASLLGRPKTPT